MAGRRRSTAQVRVLQSRTVELIARGWTVRDVAEHVGATTADVQRWLGTELATRAAPDVRKLREAELAHLDRITAEHDLTLDIVGQLDAQARTGALAGMLRVSERRAKLLALDTAAEATDDGAAVDAWLARVAGTSD